MVTFWVNGQKIETAETGSLLLFLRRHLHLMSVKCGCMQGTCGTCMVILNGKICRSCTRKVENLEGANILTAEGLSPREQDVYVYAFSKFGAIQCGYCTPAMLVSAKALLDQTPSPSEEEIREAFRFNICRCTGYVSIIKAVKLAAQLLQSGEAIPPLPPMTAGSGSGRIDAREKALGTLPFVADAIPDGTLYGAVLRAGVPHARVTSIDTSAARAIPGVAGVVTAADIPGSHTSGRFKHPWYALVGVGDEVRFPGDVVALVAAESQELARSALEHIKVEYDLLPPVFSPQRALEENAPQLYEGGNLFLKTEIHTGNRAAAQANTAYHVHQIYETPFAEHGYLETEAALAIPEDGRMVVRSADQGIFMTRAQVSAVLGIPQENVLVEGYPVGGAFGGREDILVQVQAALLAHTLKKPVFLGYTREDSLSIHAKRHPMRIEISSGCDRAGNLTYLDIDLLADKGAYSSLGLPVLERACSIAPGPYRYQAVDIVGRSVHTNNPPTGGYRGFGITQSCFAVESNLNLLAEQVGISPWEIRWRNAVAPGERLYSGQIADPSTAIRQTLLAVKEVYEQAPYAGIACGMKNCGSGSGLPDVGRCTLKVHHGHIWLHCAASMIGQGVESILPQIAASVSGVDSTLFRWADMDTDTAPDTGTATASRLTILAGEATRQAAAELKNAIEQSGLPLTQALEALEGQGFCGEFSAKTDPLGADVDDPVIHVAYGYATHVACLDGTGRVEKIVAAHDVGKAINPVNVTGQIEGGVVMSFGYALTERFEVKEGKTEHRFGAIGFPSTRTAPPVEAILVEDSPLERAMGAKGLGELTCIPTPAALAGAYYALDGQFRTRIPLENTPYSKNSSAKKG